jgi:mechanosensitive ion channel-like protein
MPHALAAINVNFGQSVQNLLNTIARSIPKIGVFLLILVVGWIVARVIGKLIAKGLERIGFNRFAERGTVGHALSRGPWDASTLIGKIVYYGLLLFVLQMAFGVFGPNPISALLDSVVAWLPKAIVAIAIVIIASAIAKVVKDLIDGAIGGLSYGPFVAGVASVLILVVGVIAALNQIGIAASVTEPVLVIGLATVAAILAIGVGGGMIKPMQARWERMLDAAERETGHHIAAYQRGRQDAAGAGAAAGAGVATGDRSAQEDERLVPSAVGVGAHGPGSGQTTAGPGPASPGPAGWGPSGPGPAGPGQAGQDPGSDRPGGTGSATTRPNPTTPDPRTPGSSGPPAPEPGSSGSDPTTPGPRGS